MPPLDVPPLHFKCSRLATKADLQGPGQFVIGMMGVPMGVYVEQ